MSYRHLKQQRTSDQLCHHWNDIKAHSCYIKFYYFIKNKTELNDEGQNFWSKKFSFVSEYLDGLYQLKPQTVIEKIFESLLNIDLGKIKTLWSANICKRAIISLTEVQKMWTNLNSKAWLGHLAHHRRAGASSGHRDGRGVSEVLVVGDSCWFGCFFFTQTDLHQRAD